MQADQACPACVYLEIIPRNLLHRRSRDRFLQCDFDLLCRCIQRDDASQYKLAWTEFGEWILEEFVGELNTTHDSRQTCASVTQSRHMRIDTWQHMSCVTYILQQTSRHNRPIQRYETSFCRYALDISTHELIHAEISE